MQVSPTSETALCSWKDSRGCFVEVQIVSHNSSTSQQYYNKREREKNHVRKLQVYNPKCDSNSFAFFKKRLNFRQSKPSVVFSLPFTIIQSMLLVWLLVQSQKMNSCTVTLLIDLWSFISLY